MNKAVFFDRDGTINNLVYRGENCQIAGKKVRFTAPWKFSELRIKAGIVPFLDRLGQKGFLRIIITNQPDLEYKLLNIIEHKKITRFLKKMPVDDIYVCPHGRNRKCLCRKPKPGMILDAVKKWKINLRESFFIGDSLTDIQVGKNVGCKTIFIQKKTEDECSKADFNIKSIFEAEEIVFSTRKSS
jgi:D-glycero-D-manno-heptose 1,7-bisphosphate phosphatase